MACLSVTFDICLLSSHAVVLNTCAHPSHRYVCLSVCASPLQCCNALLACHSNLQSGDTLLVLAAQNFKVKDRHEFLIVTPRDPVLKKPTLYDYVPIPLFAGMIAWVVGTNNQVRLDACMHIMRVWASEDACV